MEYKSDASESFQDLKLSRPPSGVHPEREKKREMAALIANSPTVSAKPPNLPTNMSSSRFCEDLLVTIWKCDMFGSRRMLILGKFAGDITAATLALG
eukprot:1349327-Amorphochlora_amoeboformis.AAC.1